MGAENTHRSAQSEKNIQQLECIRITIDEMEKICFLTLLRMPKREYLTQTQNQNNNQYSGAIQVHPNQIILSKLLSRKMMATVF